MSLEPACSRSFCFLTLLYLFRFCGFLIFCCFLLFLRYLHFLRISTFLRFCVSLLARALPRVLSRLFPVTFRVSVTYVLSIFTCFYLFHRLLHFHSIRLLYFPLPFILPFIWQLFSALFRTVFPAFICNGFRNGFCNSCPNDSVKPVAFFSVTGVLALTTDSVATNRVPTTGRALKLAR